MISLAFSPGAWAICAFLVFFARLMLTKSLTAAVVIGIGLTLAVSNWALIAKAIDAAWSQCQVDTGASAKACLVHFGPGKR